MRAASAKSSISDEQRDATGAEARQDGGAGCSDHEVSTMSRLKHSVSKLRAHLMGVGYPSPLPVNTMSDTSGDEAHFARSRKFVMATTTGLSIDRNNYSTCNDYDSEGENPDTGSVKCSFRRHVTNHKGHGDGRVKVVEQHTNYAGRRRTYYRAHARNGVSEEPHQVRYVDNFRFRFRNRRVLTVLSMARH